MLTNGREIEKIVCFTYIFSFCAIGSVNMKVNVGDRVEMKNRTRAVARNLKY